MSRADTFLIVRCSMTSTLPVVVASGERFATSSDAFLGCERRPDRGGRHAATGFEQRRKTMVRWATLTLDPVVRKRLKHSPRATPKFKVGRPTLIAKHFFGRTGGQHVPARSPRSRPAAAAP